MSRGEREPTYLILRVAPDTALDDELHGAERSEIGRECRRVQRRSECVDLGGVAAALELRASSRVWQRSSSAGRGSRRTKVGSASNERASQRARWALLCTVQRRKAALDFGSGGGAGGEGRKSRSATVQSLAQDV